MYIAVHADLPPGLQASQAVHAAHAWAIEHPEAFRTWFAESNTVVIVSTRDLDGLHARAASAGVSVSAFRDDDIGSQLTSIALGPGHDARKLCQALPLALQSKEVKAA